MKALGKKPPHGMDNPLGTHCLCMVCFAHRHIALIECADELDKAFDWDIADLRKMSKRLRISAGIK